MEKTEQARQGFYKEYFEAAVKNLELSKDAEIETFAEWWIKTGLTEYNRLKQNPDRKGAPDQVIKQLAKLYTKGDK